MWQTLDKNDVIRRLNTNEKEGLNEKEENIRKEKYGKNKLKDKKKESLIIKFLKQFNDFMIIILIVFIHLLLNHTEFVNSLALELFSRTQYHTWIFRFVRTVREMLCFQTERATFRIRMTVLSND